MLLAPGRRSNFPREPPTLLARLDCISLLLRRQAVFAPTKGMLHFRGSLRRVGDFYAVCSGFVGRQRGRDALGWVVVLRAAPRSTLSSLRSHADLLVGRATNRLICLEQLAHVSGSLY